VADDVRHSNAARPIKHGDPARGGIPRLDWHPGVEFAVVVNQLAFVVYYQAGVPRHSEGIVFHDGEAAPDSVVDAGFFHGGDFGAFESAH
jgi:hypothetical protein